MVLFQQDELLKIHISLLHKDTTLSLKVKLLKKIICVERLYDRFFIPIPLSSLLKRNKKTGHKKNKIQHLSKPEIKVRDEVCNRLKNKKMAKERSALPTLTNLTKGQKERGKQYFMFPSYIIFA